jgi:hypothetical protein
MKKKKQIYCTVQQKKFLMDVIATAKTQQQNTGYVSKRITVCISHYHPLKL